MKNFLRNNGFLLVIIAVLLAALLAIGSSILGINPLTSLVNAIGAPFRAISTAVTNWTQDMYDRSFRYEQLIAENEQLRQQLAEWEEAAREGQDALAENERLRDLLGLSNKRPDFVFVDAAVTRRSSTNWGSDLTLDQGTNAGVSVNDCVVDRYGNLVGIVTEVGLNWAQVTTILDPDTELGGRIARIDEDVIAEGDFTLMQNGQLKLTYLPADSQPVAGDQVTTSGLSGLYPRGILIGTIRSIHTEAGGISRYAVLEPAADIEDLRYAYIITSFDSKE